MVDRSGVRESVSRLRVSDMADLDGLPAAIVSAHPVTMAVQQARARPKQVRFLIDGVHRDDDGDGLVLTAKVETGQAVELDLRTDVQRGSAAGIKPPRNGLSAWWSRFVAWSDPPRGLVGGRRPRLTLRRQRFEIVALDPAETIRRLIRQETGSVVARDIERHSSLVGIEYVPISIRADPGQLVVAGRIGTQDRVTITYPRDGHGLMTIDRALRLATLGGKHNGRSGHLAG